MNHTGFVKIMKKYDKTAGWKASKAFIASKLRPTYFMSSTILDDLFKDTEDLFIENFANGHRRRGMAKLRVPDLRHQVSPHEVATVIGAKQIVKYRHANTPHIGKWYRPIMQLLQELDFIWVWLSPC